MRARLLVVVMLFGSLAGCERQVQDMYHQPRYDVGDASPLFADGRAGRAPPPDSVPAALGDLAATSSARVGRLPSEAGRSSEPQASTALLRRGRERYAIYCTPCHSPLGDGDGMVVRRGFPRPPSFAEARLRTAPDRYLFDVITQGHGAMVSYADRLAPQDRWAVVLWLRRLQAAQDTP
jgi:mono/diheme cytochrome c family protein